MDSIKHQSSTEKKKTETELINVSTTVIFKKYFRSQKIANDFNQLISNAATFKMIKHVLFFIQSTNI